MQFWQKGTISRESQLSQPAVDHVPCSQLLSFAVTILLFCSGLASHLHKIHEFVNDFHGSEVGIFYKIDA